MNRGGIAEPPVVKRNNVTVRLDADVAAKAKTVAASRNMNLAEYLSKAWPRRWDR
jgi:hypothetical protein